MILLQANRISKSFGIQPVLAEASMVINERERVGMIGANGCGKSTFLGCLSGRIVPDAGEVVLSSNTSMGCLDQMPDIAGNCTAWEAVMEGFPQLSSQRRTLAELEMKMASAETELELLMDRYARLTEEYERGNGYACETMARRVLSGLGFKSAQFFQEWSSFSGGEKTRLNLARLLVMPRDILLLDEPTNHLDIESVEWLEDFIQSFAGSVVVVSHDRRFLDRVATRILHLNHGKAFSYPGSYSRFLEIKAGEDLAWKRAYEKQQIYIQETEAYIRRFKAGIKAKQARGRQSQLDRMKRMDKPDAMQAISIRGPLMICDSGQIVLEANSICKAYGGRRILEDAGLTIRKGERLALVGPNGCGKSTLLGILAGCIPPDAGNLRLGSRVIPAYFDQENRNLNPTATVLSEIVDHSGLNLEQARTRLGSMLFTGDDVFKRTGDLSGGEKARLSLLKMILTGANLLILDEPTNHLDIESRQAIEQALAEYHGSILMVSHDRYFIDQISDTILAIESGRVARYPGKYSDYQDARASAAAVLRTAADSAPAQARKARNGISDQEKALRRSRRELAARIEELEAEISSLENSREELQLALTLPETYQDQQLARAASQGLKEVEDALHRALEEWENAVSRQQETE